MLDDELPQMKLFGPKLKISHFFDDKRSIYYVPMLNENTSSTAIKTKKLHQLGYTGKNTKGAILDSGVLSEHPYLKCRLAAIEDFTGHGPEDNEGHGTAVAIIFAMNAPDASILSGKVFENDGAPLSDQINRIAQGINWAIEKGADIISMSLGFDQRKEDLCKKPENAEAVKNVCEAIERAIQKNILIFVAAGANFPADCHKSIIVMGVIDHETISGKPRTLYPKDVIPTTYEFFDSFLVPTFVNEGYMFLSKGLYDKALDALDIATEKDLESSLIWHYRGLCFSGLKRYEDAIKSFDKALLLDQSDGNIWYHKGLAFIAISQNDRAIECFDKVMQIEDSRTPSLTKQDYALDLKDGQEIDCYPIDPNSASNAWCDMGFFYEQANRFDEAAKCYDRAIKINNRNANAYNNFGGILGRREDYENSLKYFDKAIELDPTIVDAWYNKGLALYRLNKYTESIKYLDKALEIDPSFDAASKEKYRVLRKLNIKE